MVNKRDFLKISTCDCDWKTRQAGHQAVDIFGIGSKTTHYSYAFKIQSRIGTVVIIPKDLIEKLERPGMKASHL
jgi:hypothetical protein